MGHDYFDFHPYQFRRQVRKALGFSVREAPLDNPIFSLDLTKIAHRLHERVVEDFGIRRSRARRTPAAERSVRDRSAACGASACPISPRKLYARVPLAPGETRRLQLCHMSHTITVRLNRDLAEWLDRVATKTGVAQGKIIRDQLEKAKAGGSSQSFMRLAGAVRGAKDLSRRKGFARP